MYCKVIMKSQEVQVDQTACPVGRIGNPCDPWIILFRPGTFVWSTGLPWKFFRSFSKMKKLSCLSAIPVPKEHKIPAYFFDPLDIAISWMSKMCLKKNLLATALLPNSSLFPKYALKGGSSHNRVQVRLALALQERFQWPRQGTFTAPPTQICQHCISQRILQMNV